MKTVRWVLILLALASVSAALADQAVLLRYKFVSGRVTDCDVVANGLIPMAIKPGPEAGFPALAFNISLDMRMTTRQTCEAVEESGAGVVLSTTPYLLTHSTFQLNDQASVDSTMLWDKGKLDIRLNGASQPPDANAERMAKAFALVIRSTVSPTGEAKLDPESTKGVAEMLGGQGVAMPDLSQLSVLTSSLPERAVTPGATWSRQVDIEVSGMHLAGAGQFKFAGLEDVGGTTCARIEGETKCAAVGPMTMVMPVAGAGVQVNGTRLELTISSTTFLDLQAGSVLKQFVDMTEDLEMVILVGEGDKRLQIPATIENAQMHVEIQRK
jgi:hypothetical protein